MKRYITLFLSVLVITALLLAGCSKGSETKTLESIVNSDEEVAETIQSSADSSGVVVDVKENTITYTCDISSFDGVTEEIVSDEAFAASFQTSLEAQKDTFVGVCKTLEEDTGIKGVVVKVVYTYGDKEVASASFTSADAEETSD